MAQPNEIDNILQLLEETNEIVETLRKLLTRVESKLHDSPIWDNAQHIPLLQALLDMRRAIISPCDSLISDRMSDPPATVNQMWHIIELYSSSPESVSEGTRLLERFFKLKMRSTIKPVEYRQSITAYVQWQNATVRCFVEQFRAKPRNAHLEEIVRLWNWNDRANEGMFFGGAARPLHVKKVTDFAAQMSIYYDRLWPVYKQNRSALVDALSAMLREESVNYWPNYEIFPNTSSKIIVDLCLQYFYFKDRHNTWFINSSASDYIPFVHSAREIFAENFDGADMKSPDEHTTEWIAKNLEQRCSRIVHESSHGTNPTFIILLTSKNRFGRRIDVDYIHLKLNQQFSDRATIITIVDGCQDGTAFAEVDIVVYTKRFTTTGAIGVVNRTFLLKNQPLAKKLCVGTSLPVGILAQLYISVNMMNEELAYGVEELVNSSRWQCWRSSLEQELHSVLDYSSTPQSMVDCDRGPLRYSFDEDSVGTILMLTAHHDGDVMMLPKLWALLKTQGHSLDCFVMDNPYLKTTSGIRSADVEELIANKFIDKLREFEAHVSDYLAWPLVPYWVRSADDITVEQLQEHFRACSAYHCCLRLSMGRCGYPGKLKRFVDLVDGIFDRNELDISETSLGKHSSQWLT